MRLNILKRNVNYEWGQTDQGADYSTRCRQEDGKKNEVVVNRAQFNAMFIDRCNDGWCIKRNVTSDGLPDCRDGSDETSESVVYWNGWSNFGINV